MARATPPPWILALLLALIAILPVRSALGFGEVGGYRMFTRLVQLQLSVRAEDGAGRQTPITFEMLRPHLGVDARRIVGAALRGAGAGDAAEGALTAALPELARLGCSLAPTSREVHAALTIHREATRPERREIHHRCAR